MLVYHIIHKCSMLFRSFDVLVLFYDAENSQNTEKHMNEEVLANFVLKRREEERRGKTKGCEGKREDSLEIRKITKARKTDGR